MNCGLGRPDQVRDVHAHYPGRMKCRQCGDEVDGACFACEVQPAMKSECSHADGDCWDGCDGATCAPTFVELVGQAPRGVALL